MLVSLPELWLPILVAAVVAYFASFVTHMLLPFHQKDAKSLSDDGAVADVIRSKNIAPGLYFLPFCPTPAEFKDAEVKARFDKGPHGLVSVWPTSPSWGKNLLFTFLFFVVASVFIGYITGLARPAGAEYMEVFRVAGAAGVASYALGSIPHDIWYKRPLRNVLLDLADCVAYGLLTAGVFAWLWPAATEVALPGIGG